MTSTAKLGLATGEGILGAMAVGGRFAMSAALVATCACSNQVLVLAPDWEADEQVVIVLTDFDGRAIPGRPPFVVSGPVSVEIEDVDRIRVHAGVFSPEARGPNGARFDACGIRIGGDTTTLGIPERYAVATVGVDGTVGTFMKDAREDYADLDLHFDNCELTCDGIVTTRIELVEPFRAVAITVVDDDLAFVGGGERDDGTQIIARVENNVVTEMPALPALRDGGGVRALAWDRDSRVYYTGHYRKRLKAFSLDGTQASVPEVTFVRDIRVGDDGSVFVFRERDAVGANLMRVIGSTTADVPDVPERTKEIAVHRSDRLLIQEERALGFHDGLALTPEYTLSLVESMARSDVRDDFAVLVGEIELVRVRRGPGDWERIERPNSQGRHIRDVAILEDNRLVVAGDSGLISVWTGDRWCDLESGTLLVELRDIQPSPSGRTAYVGGLTLLPGGGAESTLVRVDLLP